MAKPKKPKQPLPSPAPDAVAAAAAARAAAEGTDSGPDTQPDLSAQLAERQAPLPAKLLPKQGMDWRRRWRELSTLQVALLVSLTVHGALLTVRLVDPEGFNRMFQDSPLEVILVNARSGEVPTKAQAIAQSSLAGGGDVEKGRATSPLPPSALVEIGDANEETRRQIEQLQETQLQLLAQVKYELSILPAPDPRRDQGSPDARAQEERRRQLQQLLAEIEKRINEENARPKKRYISPATREEVYAIYYDQLRRKVEDRGTRNFPEFQGKKLYGELTMNITVDVEGQLVDAEVVRPSNSKVLDRRALAIVKSAAPFGAFSQAMRRKADQLVITSRFRFTRDEALEATMTETERR
jgi:periplasmic protein TonB